MASFFEKLIGGQEESSPVKEKKLAEKKPAVKAVKKTIKPRPVQESEPMEEEEEPEEKEEEVQEEASRLDSHEVNKFVSHEIKKAKPKMEINKFVSHEIKEAEVEEEPETVEEPVKMAPRVEKKPRVPEKEGSPELEGQLAIDVYQTSKEIIIQSTIAGVKPDNLEVTIENGMVTIRGSRSQTESVEGKNYLIQECHWGSFSRQFVLPSEVDPSRSEALLKEGILTIKIPKIQKEKVTKLLVKE